MPFYPFPQTSTNKALHLPAGFSGTRVGRQLLYYVRAQEPVRRRKNQSPKRSCDVRGAGSSIRMGLVRPWLAFDYIGWVDLALHARLT
jgi:hypothetical protein